VHNACSGSAIQIIEHHLKSRFGFDDPPTIEMVNRLKLGYWTKWDQGFAAHELIESSLMDAGALYDDAHLLALNNRGIHDLKEGVAAIYHPDLILNQYPEYFNDEIKRLSKLLAGR
jgi:hypothetical protein